MRKETFVSLIKALDTFWNDKVDGLRILGITECYFTDFADSILGAIEEEMDPKHKARDDKHECVEDCGSYVCEWLFGREDSDFRVTCPTIESLYDYIISQYQ